MATAPEPDEIEPTPVQRVRAAIAVPTSDKYRPVTLLAISAGLAALAPFPFGGLAAALLVVAAADRVRR